MKGLIFTLLISFISTFAMAQPDPATVVQQQLDAYNARDIDAFMALFHEDCRILDFPGDKVLAEGYEATRTLYQGLFDSSPELHSEIITRSVIGTKVIDHERITGRAGSDVVELAVVFEVVEGKIRSAMVIR